VGGDEDIVSVPAIRQMHADWPSGELRVIEGARHELMMETPALRGRFMSETFEFLKLSL
jgi:lysophospholipase